MDNLWVDTQDLSQVLSSIFERRMIRKIHLLDSIKRNSSERGILSSSLALILLQDFIEVKEKQKRIESRPRDSMNDFFGTKTPKKHILNFDEEEEEEGEARSPYQKNSEFLKGKIDLVGSPNAYQIPQSSTTGKKEKKSKKKSRKELLM